MNACKAALNDMPNLIAGSRRYLLTASLYGLLLSFSTPVAAQQEPGPPPQIRLNDLSEFLRLTVRARNDPATLNQERLEDLKEFGRLSPLAKQVKPYCPSMLTDELSLPEVPFILKLPPGLKALWIQAARQPEAELQLQAAEAIARASHLEGADLDDTVPLLANILDARETERVVRLATARSLIVLNARETAPALRRHAASGLEFAQLIEPVLADWNDGSMNSVWLSRLENGGTSPGLSILAIRAAAKTEMKAAIPFLRERVLDPRGAPHLRLEAAKALGKLADESIIPDARRLTASKTSSQIVLDQLLAAHMLAMQNGEEALSLLRQLAVDREPAVAAMAFQRLLEVDPQLTRQALDHASESSDPELRRCAAKALFLVQTPENVKRLSRFLTDPNLVVRSAAQEWVIQSDEIAELRSEVRLSVMSILNSGDSRGIAQAAIVVGQIDHKPAADRLIELLNHEAPDVSIAAAWALRRLAVSSTAEPILRHLVAQTENSLVEIPFSANRDLTWIWDMYEQHKHLIEVLGILRYGPADSLFRTYLPVPLGKPLNHPFHWIHCTHRVELRARAIWALGRLQRDRPSEDLVRPLTALLEDDEEPLYVSATAALSLGKIQITSAVPTLKKYYGPDMRYTEDFPRPSVLAQACRLALESITGESLPALGVVPFEKNETGWFLEPLSSADTR